MINSRIEFWVEFRNARLFSISMRLWLMLDICVISKYLVFPSTVLRNLYSLSNEFLSKFPVKCNYRLFVCIKCRFITWSMFFSIESNNLLCGIVKIYENLWKLWLLLTMVLLKLWNWLNNKIIMIWIFVTLLNYVCMGKAFISR